jgi:dolichyl-phosphate beta-glucosyltransferase
LPPPTYSIIIPAYNESVRIGATLKSILDYSSKHNWDAEVLVVNDGSTDNTVEVVQSFAKNNPALRLIQNPGNRGKGFSVRNGMLHATGKVRLFSDADLSSPIEEAPKLFAAIAEGNDIAIGSRWLKPELQAQRQPLMRRIFSRMFNLTLRIVLRLKFKDTQCGFKAFTREAAEKIFPLQMIERWGFDPELLYLGRHFGFKAAEIPVVWSHREGTRIRPLRDGIRMVGEVFLVRWYALTGKYSGKRYSNKVAAH